MTTMLIFGAMILVGLVFFGPWSGSSTSSSSANAGPSPSGVNHAIQAVQNQQHASGQTQSSTSTVSQAEQLSGWLAKQYAPAKK